MLHRACRRRNGPVRALLRAEGNALHACAHLSVQSATGLFCRKSRQAL